MNAAIRRLSPLINVIALVLCVFLSLLIPTVYFFVTYSYQAASMEVTAEISARFVSQMVVRNPDFWRFETVRLREFLSRDMTNTYIETRRIVDMHGDVIAESADQVKTPVMRRSRKIYDAGIVVGRLDVVRSIRPLLVQTLFMAVIGVLVGLVVFTALRLFPLRALARAEQLFQDARERYQALADNSLLGIAVMDTNHRIINVNATFASLFNKPASDFVGLHCFSQFEKRLAICPHCPGTRAMASRTAAEVETQGVRDDGSRFFVRIRAVPFFGIDGAVNGFIEIVENIDEKKRAEMEREAMLLRQHGINQLQQSLLALGPLEAKLKSITDGIVRLFDADFCRIWLIRPGDLCEQDCVHAGVSEGSHVCRYRDRCLHLLASSGRYTRLDGKSHRRVPFGCYKVGLIASGEEHKFITNDVQNDPRVHNHEWARELGLVSFAGYQIRVPGGETLGVLALFAKHPILPAEDALLDGLSSTVALVVRQTFAEEALKAREEQYRTLVENLNVGIYRNTGGPQGRFLQANTAIATVFGYDSLEEFMRVPVAQLYQEPTERLLFVQEVMRAGSVHNRELRLRKKDGSLMWGSLSVHAHYDAHGEIEWLDGVLIDVTEWKHAQELGKQMAMQLQQAQKMESIGHLAAGIAHEINTPIQFIGDNLQFLKTAYKDLMELLRHYGVLKAAVKPEAGALVDEVAQAERKADLEYLQKEMPKALEQSEEGVQRVSRIVLAMKEFSHPADEEMTTVDINRAIETTVTIARNEWKYVAKVETRLDPSLPFVPCLPGDINQVLLNLIVNAAHAIGEGAKEEGAVSGRITIGTRQEGGAVEIRVADNGPGIREEHRAKIFTPFFTTKEVGKGTGQGLALAYNVIVNKHHGDIRFETEAGKGTTFIIRLPLTQGGGQEDRA